MSSVGLREHHEIVDHSGLLSDGRNSACRPPPLFAWPGTAIAVGAFRWSPRPTGFAGSVPAKRPLILGLAPCPKSWKRPGTRLFGEGEAFQPSIHDDEPCPRTVSEESHSGR